MQCITWNVKGQHYRCWCSLIWWWLAYTNEQSLQRNATSTRLVYASNIERRSSLMTLTTSLAAAHDWSTVDSVDSVSLSAHSPSYQPILHYTASTVCFYIQRYAVMTTRQQCFTQIDLFAAVETWYESTRSPDLITCTPGYALIKHDHDRRGILITCM